MPNTKSFSNLRAKIDADPARRERVEEYKRAIADALTLAELRARQGLTQQELASALSVTQGNISRIEHAEDIYLSTLRNYVAALGGELEIKAVFGDQTVTLVSGEPVPVPEPEPEYAF